MSARFVSIWFRHLTTDWMIRRQPLLKDVPFVLAATERNRTVIKAVSTAAAAKGIIPLMPVADARAVLSGLQVFENKPDLAETLLKALAEWCLRFTPTAAVDLSDGLILDASGCTHLWGGEAAYMDDIGKRLKDYGYNVRLAMADTVGTAWAVARFGCDNAIIESGAEIDALLPLPPAALRLESSTLQKLDKLGLSDVRSFINMPHRALRRRFGQSLLTRISQAAGWEKEHIAPVCPVMPYSERLPSLEPIRTATGIEIALKKLLELLCRRLEKEGKGLRKCVFRTYRIDGRRCQIEIGTNRPSRNIHHLFKLFEDKISSIAPGLGIELFSVEAPVVEELPAVQDAFWQTNGGNDQYVLVSELLDRIEGKVTGSVHRYLPAEHHLPERSMRLAGSLEEQPVTTWPDCLPRPLHLLQHPELIQVTVRMPDYPPMLFRYKGKLHRIKKADGPERIEQEWWLQDGHYRDYYCVEDSGGARFWLFRLGHYQEREPTWYIHGFFA